MKSFWVKQWTIAILFVTGIALGIIADMLITALYSHYGIELTNPYDSIMMMACIVFFCAIAFWCASDINDDI